MKDGVLIRTIEKGTWRIWKKKTYEQLRARNKDDFISSPKGSDLVQTKKRRGTLEDTFNVVQRDITDKRCTNVLCFSIAIQFS